MKKTCPWCNAKVKLPACSRRDISIPDRWYGISRSVFECSSCSQEFVLKFGGPLWVLIAAIAAFILVLAALVYDATITSIFDLYDYAFALGLSVIFIAVLTARFDKAERIIPNKGFNRTPESSGPAKPGEPGGGAG